MRADIGQFEQVVVNLAVNARDAMPDGGELTIRTRNFGMQESRSFHHRELTPGEYVLVEIEDTGTGIAPDIIEKIFEPFFTTKEVGKGTGLGLSMVYGIIKQTGGFIFCDSEVGKGTVFRIFLPRTCRRSQAGRSIGRRADRGTLRRCGRFHDRAGQGIGGRRRGICPARRRCCSSRTRMRCAWAASRALKSRGYTVHEASSGVEALEIYNQLEGKIDIIVSDVVMPEMDGPTLLARAAQTAARHQVRLRLGLCRGRVRQEPSGGRQVRLPAEAVLAEAARDGGQGSAGRLTRQPMPYSRIGCAAVWELVHFVRGGRFELAIAWCLLRGS